jgi:protein-L-isoaspartate(D-aspartate) O-methyltransferase
MTYAAARHNMVENQIRTNRVTDPAVLRAMEDTPREVFVPKQLRGVAYVDEAIDLGNGRVLMEPLIFARLLQAAEIQETEVVLDVGCASGYSAAVLSHLASTVVAVESDADLSEQAKSRLNELSVDNVALVSGPLVAGDAAHGPYDVIVLEGAVAEVPASLTAQLADGGRLVAVVAGESGLGRATLVARVGDIFSSRVVFDTTAALLPGFQAKSSFRF